MSDNDRKEGNGNGTPQVGVLLRASRLRVGEDLREIADVLCIRYLYLEAIEDCRYGDLPGSTYAVGFIRSYAEHLGLDGEEVVRRFKAEQAGIKRADDLSFPTPVPDSGMPKGAIVFIGVLLALLVYGGWYVTTTDESILDNLISPVPDHLKSMVNGNEASTGTDGQSPSETDAPNMSEAPVGTPAKPDIEPTEPAVAETQAETAPESASEAAPAQTETPEAPQPEKVEPQAAETAPAPSAAATPPTETSVQAPAPQPAETVTPAPEPAQNAAEAAAPAPIETPAPAASAEAENAETATPAPTPAATPVEAANPSAQRETTAEELNALSLRRASGSSEQASRPQSDATPPPPAAAAPQPVPTTGIVVRATESSWVEIRNPADGKILFTGLMSAGKFYAVPDVGGLVLDTGNAGGLDITVDGVSAPKIGGAGIVRKGVALDEARLLAGTATNR